MSLALAVMDRAMASYDIAFLPAEIPSIPIRCVAESDWEGVAEALPRQQRAYAEATGFFGKAGSHCLLPDAEGRIARGLFGLGNPNTKAHDRFLAGKLVGLLPHGAYSLEPEGLAAPGEAALAWLLASYRFERYRDREVRTPRLVAPDGLDALAIERIAQAVARGRDLINTPSNDLGPAEIEAAVRSLAGRFGASVAVTDGEALETAFPLVHAVGRASPRAPRLINLTWGAADAPKVTLVGKGVVFDTGGLDIKPSSAMLLMKKDMGGAAAALAAAEMAMGADLPLRLRLIIPSVENAISGSAFRPGDVLRAHSGLSVEIGNTDAEGRLILADALSLADAERPDLLIDFATLTGAARVALGPDLPAFFCEDDALAENVAASSRSANDPVWRLPLHPPYERLLESKVADLNNVSGGPFAGAITAALFLRRFAPNTARHLHFDLYGWNSSTKPGHPEGGEVQTARLVFDLLQRSYAANRS